jgi:cytochrome c-type biogenesis protein CcmH
MSAMWVFGIGGLLVLGVAVFLARGATRAARLMSAGSVVAACGLGLAGYALTGRAGQPDLPFAERQAELAERAQMDPTSLSLPELMVHLQAVALERPDDPQPHYFMGTLLADMDRDDEALRAFQSALRRDQGFTPALMGLADAYTRLENGRVSRATAALYAEVFARDAGQARAGFLSGMALWEAGERDAAQELWDRARARIGEGDGAGQFEAMRAAVTAAGGAE